MIKMQEIEAKRQSVRQAYADHGFHSVEYQQGFDELHVMNMQFMAEQYRNERGLSPHARTPYCER